MARRTRILLVYNRDYGPGGDGPALGEEARAGVLKTAQAAEKAAAKLKDLELSVEGVDDPASLVTLLDRDGPFDIAINLCESLRGDPRYEIPVVVLFEARGIDYTGNPPLALRLCLDKGKARLALAEAGVPTPAGAFITTRAEFAAMRAGLPLPAIVKPGRQDGSIGIESASVVRTQAELEQRVRYVLKELGPAVVEAFIDGREFNVSILGDLEPRCLPIAEIDFSGMPADVPNIVSYKAKWDTSTKEYKGTVPVFDTTNEVLARRLRKAALGAFRALSLRDYARIDLRVDAAGNPFVVDVNPNCDLAPDAGFPRAAAKDGLEYEALIQTLIGFALDRRARRPSHGPRSAGSGGKGPASKTPSPDRKSRSRGAQTLAAPEKTTMQLRRLKLEDRPHLRSLLESTAVFAPDEIECALDVVNDILEKRDDYEAFVAADENDLPLSYVVYGPTPMTDSTWDLYWIATHARAKGQGVGTAVITRMEQDVRERKGRMVRIETSGKDAYGPTRGFYEKTSYRPIGHFPNFYRAGDDLVILAKDLGTLDVRPGIATTTRLPS